MNQRRFWSAKVLVLIMVAAAGAAFMAASGAAVDSPDQPEAACRLMPECWVDSDCDAICGVGAGKCIHSKCPVRICRCR